MSFQILISTMNNKFHERNINMKIPHIVVNQITENIVPIHFGNTYNIFSKGLSISRNYALKKSTADICLISDDDLEYLDNIDKDIVDIFDKYPDADIITFKILNPDKTDSKKYSKKPFYHNIRTLMSVSSVEIAIRKSCLKDNILFDECFGLGTTYPSGEEVIFLTDCLKQGYKILYYPLPIVIHPFGGSGVDYTDPNRTKSKGAVLYRIFGWKAFLLCIPFSIKHYKKAPYSFLKFLREMLYGCLEYSNQVKKH